MTTEQNVKNFAEMFNNLNKQTQTKKKEHHGTKNLIPKPPFTKEQQRKGGLAKSEKKTKALRLNPRKHGKLAKTEIPGVTRCSTKCSLYKECPKYKESKGGDCIYELQAVKEIAKLHTVDKLGLLQDINRNITEAEKECIKPRKSKFFYQEKIAKLKMDFYKLRFGESPLVAIQNNIVSDKASVYNMVIKARKNLKEKGVWQG